MSKQMNMPVFRLILPLLVAASLLYSPWVVRAETAGGTVGVSTRSIARGESSSQESAISAQMLPSAPFAPYVTYSMTGAWANGVGMGDFNSDGRKDVAVSDGSNGTGVWIFLQQGDGSLVLSKTYPAGVRPEVLAVGDFNQDGRDDVVTGNFGSNTISVYLQTAEGQLAQQVIYPTAVGPDALAVADLNNDGLDDLAVSHWNAPYLGVFFQQPDGGLGTMVKYASPQAGNDDIDTGDFNHDGLIDIVKMNGQGYANPNLSVYLQIPGGFAAPVSYDLGNINGDGIAAGDLTGDGLDDIALAYGGNDAHITIFAQNASGQMEGKSTYIAYDSPEPLEIADIDLDGRLGLLAAHGGWDSLSVYFQKSDGTLAPYRQVTLPYATHYKPQGLVIGDVNNDGLPDAAIGDYNHGLVMLYNQLEPDFQIRVNPIEQALELGSQVQVQLDLDTMLGFNEPVTYSVSGITPGMGYSFSQNPVTAPDSTTLYLDADPAAQTGTANLLVTGTSPSKSRSAILRILVRQRISGLSASVTGSPAFLGVPVQLKASVSAGSNVIYSWNFGDGTIGTGQIVNHTYQSLGEYTATVIAHNEISSMQAAVSVQVVDVADVPISGLQLSASFSSARVGQVVDFGATITAGTNVTYQWDFGDGGTASESSTSHAFSSPGQYTVLVTASNGQGSQTKSVVIVVAMEISGLTVSTNSPTILGSATTLQASVLTGTHVSYTWDFGDGASGSGKEANHTYAAVGAYTVRVTAKNEINSMEASLNIEVVDMPISGLQVSYKPFGTTRGAIEFTAKISAGTNVSYLWNFGDGTTGSGPVTSHVYKRKGFYNVTATVSNSQGSQLKTIRIQVK